MQVYSTGEYGINNKLTLPSDGKNVSVVLGFFDGVHLGHMKLIEESIGKDSYSVVRMFAALPKAEVLLTTIDEKLALLEKAGVDAVIIDDFPTLCGMSGRDFFEVCIASLSPARVICGFNYHFGKGAECSTDDMREFCREKGISLTTVNEFALDGVTVSSSTIRQLIADGRMEEANSMLGRIYSVTDVIRHGKELGRTIGFPTINQRPVKQKALPLKGIYSSLNGFEYGGENKLYGGVCNIGSRPTVNSDENDVTLETYIMDFSGDLYSIPVTTYFVRRLRGEMKFPSLDALRNSIARDAENARVDSVKFAELYGMKITK